MYFLNESILLKLEEPHIAGASLGLLLNTNTNTDAATKLDAI